MIRISHGCAARRYKPSNGFNATGGGFPWNHWGVGQPDGYLEQFGHACIAGDKSMTFYRYSPANMESRESDPANNAWGWNDLGCDTTLPVICAVPCT